MFRLKEKMNIKTAGGKYKTNYYYNKCIGLTHVSKFLGTSRSGGDLKFCILTAQVVWLNEKIGKSKVCVSKYKKRNIEKPLIEKKCW